MANNGYSAGLEYPEITNATNDIRTVKIILNLYASKASELTAILQYSYQAFVLMNNLPDVAKILEQISITEMHHLELLGEAIIAFGGKPLFINAQGDSYNADAVFYCTNPVHMIKRDIQDEQDAINDYTKSANEVSNESLKELFLTIAEDEKVHKKILMEVLTELEA